MTARQRQDLVELLSGVLPTPEDQMAPSVQNHGWNVKKKRKEQTQTNFKLGRMFFWVKVTFVLDYLIHICFQDEKDTWQFFLTFFWLLSDPLNGENVKMT